jgi:serine/threonine-protein kinase
MRAVGGPGEARALVDAFQEIVDKNRYRIVREVAKGGMGAVYEALQGGAEGFEKRVALKIILEELTSDPEFVAMFIGEAKLVADLIHENIVQMYQLGRVEKMYYMSLEYIDGITLEDFVLKHEELKRTLPLELCLFIISRTCRALEYAHTKRNQEGKFLGIVHRDISPGNVMMTYGGVVKLTDFGIAKAKDVMRDQEGEVLLGKVRYMSPEQAKFQTTDARSDIFALGIVLWELLAGQPMFDDGSDTISTLEHVVSRKIDPIREVNPAVPEEVAQILDRALQRDAAQRYQTAGRMGFELERFMYSNRFGPTNISLHRYLKTLYPEVPVYIDPTVPDPYFERLARSA